MIKALEILKNCRERGQKRAGGISIDEAIAELEEAMKHNSCEGCKYMTTYNETVICSNVCPCCRDYFKDRYEPEETK